MALWICVGEALTGGTSDDEFDVTWLGEIPGALCDDIVQEVIYGSEVEFCVIVVEVGAVGMNGVDVDIDGPEGKL